MTDIEPATDGEIASIEAKIASLLPGWFLNVTHEMALSLIFRVKAERARAEELEAENTRLRASLAQSKSPCVYCSLPREECAKCTLGFPGCGRANDALGCPHLISSMELHELKSLAKTLANALVTSCERHDLMGDDDAELIERARQAGLLED